MSEKLPVAVIGEGWAALASVGALATQGIPIRWITGTTTHLLAPTYGLEASPGVGVLVRLAIRLGIDFGEPQSGTFVREFRNKAFRDPMWLKGGNPETQLAARNQALWTPELRFAALEQVKFSVSSGELEQAIRAVLTDKERFPELKRIEDVPVSGFEFFEKNGERTVQIHLGSGEKLLCEKVIYAGKWHAIAGIEGLPKPLVLLKKREPMGTLQATFNHKEPLGVGLAETVFAALPRESGENVERSLWGYFYSDGMKSVWTICLSSEEGEDNHAIAKKFRKLKSTLDRAFEVTGLVPPEKGKFVGLVSDESLRFEEEGIYSEGNPLAEPIELADAPGVYFLTDGYGPSWAFAQARVFEASEGKAESEEAPRPSPSLEADL